MKRFLVAACSFFVLVAIQSCQKPGSSLEAFGLKVPANERIAKPFSAVTLDARSVNSATYKGKYLVLNFWASWCGPCVEEMPSLDTLSSNLNHDKVEVLAIDLGESSDLVATFVTKQGYTLPIALDPDSLLTASWSLTAIPMSYVISPNGRIIAYKEGAFNWAQPGLKAALEGLTP